MDIISFLKFHKIKWQPISFEIRKNENGIFKKHLTFGVLPFTPKTTDFYTKPGDKVILIDKETLKNRQKKLNSTQYIAIDTSKIQQIDIDDEYIDESYKQNLINNNPFYMSANKGLPHIFVKLQNKTTHPARFYIDNKYKHKTDGNNNECLNGQWAWCDKNTILFNADNNINLYSFNILNMTPHMDILDQAIDIIEEPQLVSILENKSTPKLIKFIDDETDKINELLSKLGTHRFKYNDWLKIGMIIKNSKCDIKVWIDWSKNSNDFNEEECIKKWKSFDTNGKINIGTLVNMVYEDKPEDKLEKYINESLDGTDYSIAKVIYELNKNNIICTNIDKLVFYRFTGIYWKIEKGGNFIKLIIVDDYVKLLYKKIYELTILANKIEDPDEQQRLQDKAKTIMKNIKSVKTTKKQKDILAQCALLFFNEKFINKLDKNWNLFLFENKVFDITADKFINPLPEQYMSITTGYDYIEEDKDINERKMKELDELFNKAFMDDFRPEKDIYLMNMATGLEGRALENFNVCQGGGGNFKSVSIELAEATYGDYYYKGVVDSLMKSMGTGANVELSKLHKKRFVTFSEPPANKKICSSTICDLTGGNNINVRTIYSEETHCRIHMTAIMDCNKQPEFDSIHEGIGRRLLNTKFKSTFLSSDKYEILKNDGVNMNQDLIK
jgi:hypothetical protein